MGRKKGKRKNKRGANGGHSDHHHSTSSFSSNGDSSRDRGSSKLAVTEVKPMPPMKETIKLASPTEEKLKIDARTPEKAFKDMPNTGRHPPNIAAEVAKELGQRILEATKENVPPPQMRGTDFCPLLDRFTREEAQPISIGKIQNPASLPDGFGDAEPDFPPLSKFMMGAQPTMAEASGYSSLLESFNLPPSHSQSKDKTDDEEDEWVDADTDFHPLLEDIVKVSNNKTDNKATEINFETKKIEEITSTTKTDVSEPAKKKSKVVEEDDDEEEWPDFEPLGGDSEEEKKDEEKEVMQEYPNFGGDEPVEPIEELKDIRIEVPILRSQPEKAVEAQPKEEEDEWPEFTPLGEDFPLGEDIPVEITKEQKTEIKVEVVTQPREDDWGQFAPLGEDFRIDDEKITKEPQKDIAQEDDNEEEEWMEFEPLGGDFSLEIKKEEANYQMEEKPNQAEKRKAEEVDDEEEWPEFEALGGDFSLFTPAPTVEPKLDDKAQKTTKADENQKEKSPQPIKKEITSKLTQKERTPEPKQKEKSPEPKQKEKTPEPKTKEKTPVVEVKQQIAQKDTPPKKDNKYDDAVIQDMKGHGIKMDEMRNARYAENRYQEFLACVTPGTEPKRNRKDSDKQTRNRKDSDKQTRNRKDSDKQTRTRKDSDKQNQYRKDLEKKKSESEKGAEVQKEEQKVAESLNETAQRCQWQKSAEQSEGKYQKSLADKAVASCCVKIQVDEAEVTEQNIVDDLVDKMKKLEAIKLSEEAEKRNEERKSQQENVKMSMKTQEEGDFSGEAEAEQRNIVDELVERMKDLEARKSQEKNVEAAIEKSKEVNGQGFICEADTEQENVVDELIEKMKDLEARKSEEKEIALPVETAENFLGPDREQDNIVDELVDKMKELEGRKSEEKNVEIVMTPTEKDNFAQEFVFEEEQNNIVDELVEKMMEQDARKGEEVGTMESNITKDKAVTYASVVKETAVKAGHKMQIVEIDEVSTQTSPKKAPSPDTQPSQCHRCGASLPGGSTDMTTELIAEKGRRMAADSVAEMAEKEATTYRLQMIQYQKQLMQIEEENINLKSELTHERHIAAGYKNQSEDLTRALERSREMIVQLEEQMQHSHNSMTEAELVLEAQLANKRAVESLAKFEGAQADLEQAKSDKLKLQQQVTELTREKNDMVPLSLHTELVMQAEDRAKEMELKSLQMQAELEMLRSQQSCPWSAQTAPGAQWGAVGNGRTSGGETGEDWPSLGEPQGKVSWAFVAARPPKNEVDISSLPSSEQVPTSPGLQGLNVSRFAPSPQAVTPELTSGEESDWSTSEESSSEKTPATAPSMTEATATSPPEGTAVSTGEPGGSTVPATVDAEGFTVAKVRPPVPQKPKTRMRCPVSPKVPSGAPKSKVPPKVPPKPSWRPPQLGQGSGAQDPSDRRGERSSSFDEEAETPKLKTARKPRGPADRRKPSKYAK